MMQPRSWMTYISIAAAGLVGGLSLGAYAVNIPVKAVDDRDNHGDAPVEMTSLSTGLDGNTLRGPQSIKCTGCGPTLSERQWARDMAAYGGDLPPGGDYGQPSTERFVNDEDDVAYRVHYADYDQPRPEPRLADMAERFVAGDDEADMPGRSSQSGAAAASEVELAQADGTQLR